MKRSNIVPRTGPYGTPKLRSCLSESVHWIVLEAAYIIVIVTEICYRNCSLIHLEMKSCSRSRKKRFFVADYERQKRRSRYLWVHTVFVWRGYISLYISLYTTEALLLFYEYNPPKCQLQTIRINFLQTIFTG